MKKCFRELQRLNQYIQSIDDATAAGVWLKSRRQAESWQGQLLGIIMTSGLSMAGAFGLINLLSKYGRDKILIKGVFFGTTFGSIITAMLSGLAHNKVKPKDAASDLSYIVSSAVFGVVTALVASNMGHDSIYDAPSKNNWVNPTEKTTEELRIQNQKSSVAILAEVGVDYVEPSTSPQAVDGTTFIG